MKTKIKGFTIAELLIAMIISGILAAGAYNAFLSFRRQFIIISKSSILTTSFFTLYNYADDQFWSSDSVLYSCCDTLIFYSNDTVSSALFCDTAGIILNLPSSIDTFRMAEPEIVPNTYSETPLSRFRIHSAAIRGKINNEEMMIWIGW